ncbi:ABC transporter permease [Aeromicrobium duanguangcaii]|uniref:ABC transporter permease n=1 Tax=Aeromicrobium duanguangcaii TaxID=2968086 RepID=UPI0020175B5B|nr:ABC transporter permease [Aeromicrobium duanguangcaii]MCL3838251.1 ABC transporter permease [Aeromicrobium duanguangcaii]
MTIPGIHVLMPRHSRRAAKPQVLTPRRGILRYFKEQPLGAAAAIIIVVFVALAALAPWLAPYNPLAQSRDEIMVPPGGGHLMGTDELGRDVLSRVMYGARTSLLISVATLAIGGLIGLVLGIVSGYFGGTWIDTVIQRVMDSLMAVPSIVLLLFVAALLGPSIRNTILALALLVVPAFNRVSRGEMLRIREETYVEAARAVGCSTPRILFRYGLPNLMAPLFVVTSLLFAIVLIAESALSFLGIGTPPPTPSWGRMLSEASRQLEIAPWMALFPGLALSLSVLAFNLLGDALRDFLDPKQRR